MADVTSLVQELLAASREVLDCTDLSISSPDPPILRAKDRLRKAVGAMDALGIYDPWTDPGWEAADDPSFEGLQ